MNNNDTNGDRVGMRRIQRVALPFQRDGVSLEEVAGCFRTWNAQSLNLKATNFRDWQGSLLTPPSN